MSIEEIWNVTKILFSGIGVTLEIFILTLVLAIPLRNYSGDFKKFKIQNYCIYYESIYSNY